MLIKLPIAIVAGVVILIMLATIYSHESVRFSPQSGTVSLEYACDWPKYKLVVKYYDKPSFNLSPKDKTEQIIPKHLQIACVSNPDGLDGNQIYIEGEAR